MITEAYVELNQAGWGYTFETTLSLEDVASPGGFSPGDTPYDRWANRTSFKLDWTWSKESPGSWIRTPSLVDGIQELVDTHRGIDALVLLEDGTGVTQGQYHDWMAYDGTPSLAAKLHIVYSLGTP